MAENSNLRWTHIPSVQGDTVLTPDNARALPTANQNEYGAWFQYHSFLPALDPAKGSNHVWTIVDELRKEGETVRPQFAGPTRNVVNSEVIGLRGSGGGFVNYFTVKSVAKPDSYLRAGEKAADKNKFRQSVLNLLGWRI